jgi:hypothetical protein
MLGLLAGSLVGLGLSGGVGSSYDYLGARLDFRIWHVAVSGALGTSGVALLDTASYDIRDVESNPALGLRVFSGEGEDFVAALTWTGHRYNRPYDQANILDRTARLDTATLTAGWHFRWKEHFFLEAAAGAGFYTRSGHPSVSGHDSTPGPFRRTTSFILDISVGVGFEL